MRPKQPKARNYTTVIALEIIVVFCHVAAATFVVGILWLNY